ncbi:glutathione peroxidase [Paenibacillus nanensis]|uniref:Glutathione peroxidase n=1 Tax=Paenibacillus nanensis TaxID=393251 RepID=A0A3A1UM18_9BACL|nr:glutathione peroxidase [Paenibacillus nanensis]RIX48722.1 glutathione peroxidase [Paenibacillus nanensis]
MSIYHYSATAMNGKDVSLGEYRGQVVLIVNVASRCGFTFQYKDLQTLYEKYKDRGFTILGFPCNQFADQEPDSNEKVQAFCTLNYGVSFPMFQKVNVRDHEAHPLFTYLAGSKSFAGFDETHSAAKILLALIQEKVPHYMEGDSIKWNFTKFLVGRDGNVLERFESTADPFELEPAIEAALQR